MFLNDGPKAAFADLDWTLERCIACRTHGRIRQLDVEAGPNGIVVRGFASSYYLKQLAMAAVSEFLSSTPASPAVDVDIQVCASGLQAASI